MPDFNNFSKNITYKLGKKKLAYLLTSLNYSQAKLVNKPAFSAFAPRKTRKQENTPKYHLFAKLLYYSNDRAGTKR